MGSRSVTVHDAGVGKPSSLQLRARRPATASRVIRQEALVVLGKAITSRIDSAPRQHRADAGRSPGRCRRGAARPASSAREQEPELGLRLLRRRCPGRAKTRSWIVAAVDTDAAAADLDAVEHEVVGLRRGPRPGRSSRQREVLPARRGERMVDRDPAVAPPRPTRAAGTARPTADPSDPAGISSSSRGDPEPQRRPAPGCRSRGRRPRAARRLRRRRPPPRRAAAALLAEDLQRRGCRPSPSSSLIQTSPLAPSSFGPCGPLVELLARGRRAARHRDAAHRAAVLQRAVEHPESRAHRRRRPRRAAPGRTACPGGRVPKRSIASA